MEDYLSETYQCMHEGSLPTSLRSGAQCSECKTFIHLIPPIPAETELEELIMLIDKDYRADELFKILMLPCKHPIHHDCLKAVF